MIRKAIIEKIESNGYQARVRIPILDRAKDSLNSTPTDQLRIASICSLPGIEPIYQIGDVVYIGFENDIEDNPIILGLVYQNNLNTISTSNLNPLSLIVKSSAILPEETKIKDFDCRDINYYLTLINSLNERLTKLENNS